MKLIEKEEYGKQIDARGLLIDLWQSLEHSEACLKHLLKHGEVKRAHMYFFKCATLKMVISCVFIHERAELTEEGKEYLKFATAFRDYTFLPDEDFGAYDYRKEIVWDEETKSYSYPKSPEERLLESIFGEDFDMKKFRRKKNADN